MKSSKFGSHAGRSGAMCALVAAMQLAGCGGGGDGAAPTPPPPVGNEPPPAPPAPPPPPPPAPPPPPPPATVSLQLEGTVTDEPIANAVVTATVGSETFTATADANGNYSLDIEVLESNASQFVTLNARGVGAQSFVEFTSLAGSFQSLAAAAGTDGTLTSAENFSTQITNVSTAAAVLMRDANGGQAITTDAALSSLVSQVNAQEVLDLAAAIKLAVDEPETNPLPAGATSILALASDPTARQQFVDDAYEQDPQAFAAAQSAIAADPRLAQPLVAAALVEQGGFTTAMLSTDAGFSFNYTGRVVHFDILPNGAGYVSTDTHNVPITWSVDGTKLLVTYPTPIETVSFDTENCVGDGGIRQVEAHYTTTGAVVTYLNPSQVTITTTSNVTYADCASLAPRQHTSTEARTVLSLDNVEVIDRAELVGAVQTLYVWDAVQGTVVADVADLGDGTGHTRLTNQDFTWTLEEGGKLVHAEFANGARADYLSFGDVDEVASDIFWEVRAPNDGPVLMGAGASVLGEPAEAMAFTVDEVPGTYYQFGVGDEAFPDPRLKGFRLRFNADFTGVQAFDLIDSNDAVVLVDHNTDPSNLFRWSLENDAIVVRRTWDVVAEVANCVYTAPDCELFDERRIVPLAMEGNRLYWIEERRLDWENGISPSTFKTRLVRYYDVEPLTGAGKLRSGAFGNKSRKLARGSGLR